jgi:L-lactate utilization protein LutC
MPNTNQPFLDRIKSAAAAGRAYRVAPHGELTDRTGYLGVAGDLVQRFAAEVNAVGGTAHIVPDVASLRQAVNDLVHEYNVKSALIWRHPLLDRISLRSIFAESHVSIDDYDSLAPLFPDERRRQFLAADLGVTSADFAIAETGTLALFSRPGQERLASLAPPVHLAIIQRRQIVADLFDLFDQLGGGLPSNLVLVTGPSKTGDIELELTTGVHGPGHWHVIILDER